MWYKLWPVKQNYQATVCFKLIQYGYETFQNAKPALLNHIAKTSKRFKFITNLHSVICSEMHNVSLIYKLNTTVKRKG